MLPAAEGRSAPYITPFFQLALHNTYSEDKVRLDKEYRRDSFEATFDVTGYPDSCYVQEHRPAVTGSKPPTARNCRRGVGDRRSGPWPRCRRHAGGRQFGGPPVHGRHRPTPAHPRPLGSLPSGRARRETGGARAMQRRPAARRAAKKTTRRTDSR